MVSFSKVALFASVAAPALGAPVRTICHSANGCTPDTLITLPDRRAAPSFQLPDQHFGPGQDGCTDPNGCTVPGNVQIAREPEPVKTICHNAEGCTGDSLITLPDRRATTLNDLPTTQTIPFGSDGCAQQGGCTVPISEHIKRGVEVAPRALPSGLPDFDPNQASDCPIEGCNFPPGELVA